MSGDGRKNAFKATPRYLVEQGADVNAANMLGETPLISAVRSSTAAGGLMPPMERLIHAILIAKADPNRTDAFSGESALMEAACSGDAWKTSISQY